jgi:2-polyprenyl-3-methyl-5-hydroxy-6-metoxy-1,4-benzoquinol methylase
LTETEKERLYSCFRDVALRNESNEEYFQRITKIPIENSENHEKYVFLQPFLKDNGKHMDVGGGLGVFCFGFQKYFENWNSICVEPSDGADIVANRHGIKSFNTYLSDDSSRLLGKDFDLITANHVVEHVDDPVSFLKMLKGFVSKTGIICIEMPSVMDIGFLDKSHDRFMSQHEVIHDKKSVEFIAKEVGLRVIYNDNYISKRGRNNVRAILCKE